MDPRTKISVSDPNFFIGRSSVPGRNYPRLEWPLGFSVLGQSLPQGQSVLCNSFPPPTQWAILTPHFMMELCKNCPGYFFPSREVTIAQDISPPLPPIEGWGQNCLGYFSPPPLPPRRVRSLLPRIFVPLLEGVKIAYYIPPPQRRSKLSRILLSHWRGFKISQGISPPPPP